MKSVISGQRIIAVALVSSLLIFLPTSTLHSQQPDLTPWVLVVPAANETGDSSLDAVGATVAQTIDISLRLLGEFKVRTVPEERIPAEVVSGDPEALAQFSEAETIDYVVFGSVSTDSDENIVIEAAVWDRGAGSVTVEQRQTAFSLFETFSVADELAQTFLSAFSGQRIAFGTVRLERSGWSEGSYRVLVDGAQVATDTTVVSNVLIGERTVEVIAANGPEAGSVLLRETVTVNERQSTALAFTFPEPPPEPADDPEPTEETEETALQEEPVEEPESVAATEPEDEPQDEPANEPAREPQIEVSPRPWSRNTRTVAGRRPIVSYGASIKSLHQPANGDWFSGGQLDLGIDFSGGWHLGFDIGISTSTGIIDDGTLVETEQIRNDIANGAEIDLRLADLLGVRASVGYRLGEWQWGPARVDLTPVGRAGLDAWGPSFYSGDVRFWQLQTADGISDFLFPQGMLGLGIMSRVHLWRFSLVGQLYADYNVPLGPDRVQEGDELYLSEDPTTPITTVSSIDPGLSPSFSIGGSLGLALSTGGRAPNRSDDRNERDRWSRRERRAPGRWPVVALGARGAGGTLGQGISGLGFELVADIDFARRMYAGISAGALGTSPDLPELTQGDVLGDPDFWNDPAISIDAQPAEQYRFVGSVGYALVSYPLANSSFDVIGLGRFGFSRTQTAFILSSSREEELIATDYSPDQFDYDRTITGVGVLGRWHRGRLSVQLGMHLDAATLTDSSFSLTGEELVVLPDADAGGEFATGRTITSAPIDRTVVAFTGFLGVALSLGGTVRP